MKKACLFASLLCVLFSGSALAAGGDMGGTDPNGSSDYPYLIEDLADFDRFASDPNYWAAGVHTKLMTDIDLSGRTYTAAVIAPNEDVEDITSIFEGIPFAGIFDGNNFAIVNLTIDTTGLNNDYLGLFGKLDFSAEVKSLGTEDITITGGLALDIVGCLAGHNSGGVMHCYSTGSVSGGTIIGGLVGRNSGSLIHCYSTCSVSGDSYIGGFVGRNYSDNVTDCSATGNVSGDSYIGGFAGGNTGTIRESHATGSVVGNIYIGGLIGHSYYDNSEISDCNALGMVHGTDYVGGLIGHNEEAEVNNCYAVGDVNSIGDYAGGLIGRNDGITSASGGPVSDCRCKGSVISSGNYIGGLIGGNSGPVSDCSVAGDVNSIGDYVGGLIGGNHDWYVPISSCHVIGSISGGSNVGGLVGYNYHGWVSNCYMKGFVSGNDSVGGLIGSNYYGVLRESCVDAQVTGTGNSIGGLIGAHWSKSSIVNCYASGSVTGDLNVGGLCGKIYMDSVVGLSYSTSTVIGNANVGGLIGSLQPTHYTNRACFWDIETSGISDGVGNMEPDPVEMMGKTTEQMMTQSTFTGWDFDPNDGDPADWMMLRELEDYPRLAWQPVYAGDIAGLYGVDMVDFEMLSRCWYATVDLVTELDDDNDEFVGLSEIVRLGQYWMQIECGICGGIDITGNGDVNADDLMEIAYDWLSVVNPDCGRADIDDSGDVDLSDLAAVTADWLR